MTSEMIARKYHDVRCGDLTRGVDRLLDLYQQDRDDITTLMINQPEKLVDHFPIPIDTGCQCRMGKGDVRSSYACVQCKSLRRLIDFRTGKACRVFRIECGRWSGSTLNITKCKIHTPYLMWDSTAAYQARMFLKKYQNLTLCGTPDISNQRCIVGDNFTIRTLLTWIVHRLFQEKGLPHSEMIHTAFVCGKSGYMVRPAPSIGSFDQLCQTDLYAESPSSILRTILIQLLVIFRELKGVNFCHGNPSIHSITFDQDPVSYEYKHVHVDGPITIRLSNLHHASATIGDVHYHSKNMIGEMNLDRGMLIPEIETRTDGPGTCSTSNFYRLTASTADIYSAMRHIGFPLYVGSLDLYCFIVSLMMQPNVYQTVIQDEFLGRIWDRMWLPVDKHIMENRLTSDRRFDSAVDLIRGVWLRCDIISILWSEIQM